MAFCLVLEGPAMEEEREEDVPDSHNRTLKVEEEEEKGEKKRKT